MAESGFTAVGRVVKPHGLKGELSIASVTGGSLLLEPGMTAWFVPPIPGISAVRVTNVRPGPKGPLVTFSSVTDIETASRLAGRDVLVASADVVVPIDAELDLSGYVVTDETRGEIGTIVETIITGANDVWVVEGHLGEILIPVIDDVVISIDENSAVVRVRLLEGLVPGE